MLTLRLVIILVSVLLAVPALPASTEPAADTPRQSAPPDRPPNAGSESQPADANHGADTFVPSEKVSEDLAVAFPVDI